MRVAVTGSTGLIGTALVVRLREEGHDVTRLVRDRSRAREPGAVFWDPARGEVDAAGLEGHDVVVHLAGESLVGIWTRAKKRRIRESRVRGTRVLAEALAGLARPPLLLLAASAIGFYGPREPDEVVDESTPAGRGFLAEVAAEWEAAAEPARHAGIRVVHARFGLVLSPRGGALAKMLPVFRPGLGGTLGSGEQIWSWIALDDVVEAALHVVRTEALAGPVNFTAPEPVSNAEFTRVLGRVLRRPAPFGVPAFAARLVAGEMAEEMLLAGAYVVPRRLLDSGYGFRLPALEPALRRLLG
jgi:uncharacterized protein (TIGR01777 family)